MSSPHSGLYHETSLNRCRDTGSSVFPLGASDGGIKAAGREQAVLVLLLLLSPSPLCFLPCLSLFIFLSITYLVSTQILKLLTQWLHSQKKKKKWLHQSHRRIQSGPWNDAAVAQARIQRSVSTWLLSRLSSFILPVSNFFFFSLLTLKIFWIPSWWIIRSLAWRPNTASKTRGCECQEGRGRDISDSCYLDHQRSWQVGSQGVRRKVCLCTTPLPLTSFLWAMWAHRE